MEKYVQEILYHETKLNTRKEYCRTIQRKHSWLLKHHLQYALNGDAVEIKETQKKTSFTFIYDSTHDLKYIEFNP